MPGFGKIGVTLGLAAIAIGTAPAQAQRGGERPSQEPYNEEEEGLSGDESADFESADFEGGSDGDNAITECVAAAKSEGGRYARIAEIGRVDSVRRSDRGWDIRGTLILRSRYRHLSRDEYGFRCRVDAQGVEDVFLEDDFYIIN